jgi:type IV secretory pathway VirB4 component
MTADDTLFDAYAVLRDRVQANDAEALEFIAGISEAEITHFQKSSETAHFAERHVFAYFKPEEYPRHSELAELLRLRPSQEHNREEVAELAALMDNWSVYGEYGPLFDGVTNRRFDSRVVHFELAKADNSDLALRGAIALNITGRIRQRIVTMPLALRKRFTMEELARLVLMPGGVKLTLELSAQLAKYNCVFAFILQDFAQIAHIEGISSLLNNTRQWLILRHDDVKELGLFSDRILLPESMREAVSKYPIPLNLPEANRYSASCYFSRSAVPQISGTLHYSFAQHAA